jgi:hypothetical protein
LGVFHSLGTPLQDARALKVAIVKHLNLHAAMRAEENQIHMPLSMTVQSYSVGGPPLLQWCGTNAGACGG